MGEQVRSLGREWQTPRGLMSAVLKEPRVGGKMEGSCGLGSRRREVMGERALSRRGQGPRYSQLSWFCPLIGSTSKCVRSLFNDSQSVFVLRCLRDLGASSGGPFLGPRYHPLCTR